MEVIACALYTLRFEPGAVLLMAVLLMVAESEAPVPVERTTSAPPSTATLPAADPPKFTVNDPAPPWMVSLLPVISTVPPALLAWVRLTVLMPVAILFTTWLPSNVLVMVSCSMLVMLYVVGVEVARVFAKVIVVCNTSAVPAPPSMESEAVKFDVAMMVSFPAPPTTEALPVILLTSMLSLPAPPVTVPLTTAPITSVTFPAAAEAFTLVTEVDRAVPKFTFAAPATVMEPILTPVPVVPVARAVSVVFPLFAVIASVSMLLEPPASVMVIVPVAPSKVKDTVSLAPTNAASM